jgi:sugar lactone lactonase YvrE
MRYDINLDDTVSNGRVFVPDFSDGMKVDQKGNLFTTTGGGGRAMVRITSPDGKSWAPCSFQWS